MYKRFLAPLMLLLMFGDAAFASNINPTDYSFRRPVQITSQATLSDYQVKVTVDTASLISAGKMRSDCADARFTDSDKLTLFWYWLESGCNSPNTVFWVRVPEITPSKTIYLYYGRPGASSGSSGENTFSFFEGFDSSTLDSSRWPQENCASVSEGILKLSKKKDMCYIVSKSGTLKSKAAVRYRAYRGGGEKRFGPAVQLYSVWGERRMVLGCYYDTEYTWGLYSYNLQKWYNKGSCDNNWHVYEMAYDKSMIYHAKVDSTTVVSSKQDGETTNSYMQLYGGKPELYGDSDSYFDYILVRNYNYPEPSAEVRSEEPTVTTTTTTTTSTTQTQTTTTAATTTTVFQSDICIRCCIVGTAVPCRFRCDQGQTDLGITNIYSCSYNSNYISIQYSSGIVSQSCSNGYCIDYVSSTTTTTTSSSTTTTTTKATTTTSSTLTSLSTTTSIQTIPSLTSSSFLQTTSTTTPPATTTTTYPAPTTTAQTPTTTQTIPTSLSTTTIPTTSSSTTIPVAKTTYPASTSSSTVTPTSTGAQTTSTSVVTPTTNRLDKPSTIPAAPTTLPTESTKTITTHPPVAATTTIPHETGDDIIKRFKKELESAPVTTIPEQDPFTSIIENQKDNIKYAAIGVAALLGLFLLLFLLPAYRKKRRRERLLKDYYEQQQKVAALRKVRKNIMHEYYTRKISEDEARRRILDTEKEIIIERTKMERTMHLLGITSEKDEENPDIIEWITEKLNDGVDPETIKTALRDMAIDSGIVDKVRKTLK